MGYYHTRPVYDFNYLQANFRARAHETLGRKLANQVFAKYDETAGHFIIGVPDGCFEMIQDPSTGHTKYKRKPRSEWGLHPVATLSPTRLEVLDVLRATWALKPLGVFAQTCSTNQNDAEYEWMYFFGTKREYTPIKGAFAIDLVTNEFVGGDPINYRVTDKSARKGMCTAIHKTRFAFKVRAKMGAFPKMYTADEVIAAYNEFANSLSKDESLSGAESLFAKSLKKIASSENPQTADFFPILADIYAHQSRGLGYLPTMLLHTDGLREIDPTQRAQIAYKNRHYRSWDSIKKTRPEWFNFASSPSEFLAAFERAIERNREFIRSEFGAISYAPK